MGELLNGQAYRNAYELADELARLSGRAAEDLMRERLMGHYERRVAFERAFENGKRFRYGALNAGGAGPTNYDPYCVVLTRTFQDSLMEIAYMPGDSLKICLRADASLDEDAVKRGATPHTHRHLMVAIERSTEIAPLGKQEWHSLVALQGRYFEVIFIGDVSLGCVECVCVPKAENDRMWELAFASFGRKLEDGERALAHDFIVLRRGVVEGRLRLEVVA